MWSIANDCFDSTSNWVLAYILRNLDQWRFIQDLRQRRFWLGLLIKIVFFAGTYSTQRWMFHPREALRGTFGELYPKQWVSIDILMWTCTSQALKTMGNLGLTWQRKPFLLLRIRLHGSRIRKIPTCNLGFRHTWVQMQFVSNRTSTYLQCFLKSTER